MPCAGPVVNHPVELSRDGNARRGCPSSRQHLAQYAADQAAELILISADDDHLVGDLRDLVTPGDPDHGVGARVETVPR